MGINIGAFVCNFVAAYLRNNYNWGYAFAAAGVGMVLALIWFSTGLKHVKHADVIKPSKGRYEYWLKLLCMFLCLQLLQVLLGGLFPEI